MTINSRIFQTPKTRIFFKGVNPWFWPKNAIFSLFGFDQNNTKNNAFWLSREKKPFLTIKKRIFQSPKKSLFFFSKGLTHAFGQKILLFLYFDLIKIRLGLMLSDFQEKKTTFFDHKKQRENFWKSKKSHFFKGLNPCSWTKNANFSLVRFGQNNTA